MLLCEWEDECGQGLNDVGKGILGLDVGPENRGNH